MTHRMSKEWVYLFGAVGFAVLCLMAFAMMLAEPAHAAFDGNGNFNRLYNWQTDKANGINIRADRMDAEMDGFAVGLSTCYTKDGQSQPSANLPMNGYRFTGAGTATDSAHFTVASQVRDNTLCTGTVAGSANAYTLTRTIPAPSLTTGTVVWLTVPTTNTNSATLNVDALGAKPVYHSGRALVGGELISGTSHPFFYDGTNWQVLGGITTPTALGIGLTSVYLTSGTTTSNTATISLTVAGTQVGYFTSNSLVVSGSILPSTPLGLAYGGTGLVSYTAGDLIYASDTKALLKLPKGSAYQLLRMNAGGTYPEWADRGGTSGLVNTTSGATVTLTTAIPMWATRIFISLVGVSTNGSANVLVQGGSGSFETSGYDSASSQMAGAVASGSSTSGFVMQATSAAETRTGTIILTNVGGNSWVASGVLRITTAAGTITVAGSKTFSGVLDRIQLNTANGTDTFDAGTATVTWQ